MPDDVLSRLKAEVANGGSTSSGGNPKIRAAADTLRSKGVEIPDDVVSDFDKVTSHESGRSHFNPNGSVKLGPPTRTGARAIGYSQIMPDTAKPWTDKYGLDPLKEPDNIAMGLGEFYNGSDDPVGRRIAYAGGPHSVALKQYKKTGVVPNTKLYSYLPNNKETFHSYVESTGGFDGNGKKKTEDPETALYRMMGKKPPTAPNAPSEPADENFQAPDVPFSGVSDVQKPTSTPVPAIPGVDQSEAPKADLKDEKGNEYTFEPTHDSYGGADVREYTPEDVPQDARRVFDRSTGKPFLLYENETTKDPAGNAKTTYSLISEEEANKQAAPKEFTLKTADGQNLTEVPSETPLPQGQKRLKNAKTGKTFIASEASKKDSPDGSTVVTYNVKEETPNGLKAVPGGTGRKTIKTGTKIGEDVPQTVHYSFEDTGKFKLNDGSELKYLGKNGAGDQYRFQDADKETYTWNEKDGLQDDSLAQIQDSFPIHLVSQQEKPFVPVGEAQKRQAFQIAAQAADKYDLDPTDVYDWTLGNGFTDIRTGKTLPNERLYGDETTSNDIYSLTRRQVREMVKFGQDAKQKRTAQLLQSLSTGTELTPELLKQYRLTQKDLDDHDATAQQNHQDDTQTALVKGRVAQQDMDLFTAQVQSGADTPATRAAKQQLSDFGLDASNNLATKLIAARRAGRIDEGALRQNLADIANARSIIRTQLQSERLGPGSIQHPEAREDRSQNTVTEADIDARLAQLQKFALTVKDVAEAKNKTAALQAAERDTSFKGQVHNAAVALLLGPLGLAFDPYLTGDLARARNTLISAPSLTMTGDTLKMVAGVVRPFSEDAAAKVSREGSKMGAVAEQIGDNGAVKFVMTTATGLIPLVLASETPLGLVGGFAATGAAKKYGEGSTGSETGKEALKQGGIGLVFNAAEPVANAVAKKFLSLAAPEVFGEAGTKVPWMTPEKLLAGENAVATPNLFRRMFPTLSDETINALKSPAAVAKFREILAKGESVMLNSDLRNLLTVAKVLKAGARVGTITLGTLGVEKVSGASPEEAKSAAIQNVLMDAILTYLPEVGGSALRALNAFKGKTYDIVTEDGHHTVTLDKDGHINSWDKVPRDFVDATIYAKNVTPRPGDPGVESIRPNQTTAEAKTEADGMDVTHVDGRRFKVVEDRGAQLLVEDPKGRTMLMPERKFADLEDYRADKSTSNEEPKEATQAEVADQTDVQPLTGERQDFITERPVTLDAQREAMLDPKRNSAIGVLYTDPKTAPALETGVSRFKLPDGELQVNNAKFEAKYGEKPGKKLLDIESGTIPLEDLIGGKAVSAEDTTSGTALVTKDAEGNELNASKIGEGDVEDLTPEEKAAVKEQIKLDKERFGDKAMESGLAPAEEVIASRNEDRPVDTETSEPLTERTPRRKTAVRGQIDQPLERMKAEVEARNVKESLAVEKPITALDRFNDRKLGRLGYSEERKAELTPEDRTRILKERIPARDFYRKSPKIVPVVPLEQSVLVEFSTRGTYRKLRNAHNLARLKKAGWTFKNLNKKAVTVTGSPRGVEPAHIAGGEFENAVYNLDAERVAQRKPSTRIGKTFFQPKTGHVQTLWQAVRNAGGIKESRQAISGKSYNKGELDRVRHIPGIVNNESGSDAEHMAKQMYEAGYLHDIFDSMEHVNGDELLRAIEEDYHGEVTHRSHEEEGIGSLDEQLERDVRNQERKAILADMYADSSEEEIKEISAMAEFLSDDDVWPIFEDAEFHGEISSENRDKAIKTGVKYGVEKDVTEWFINALQTLIARQRAARESDVEVPASDTEGLASRDTGGQGAEELAQPAGPEDSIYTERGDAWEPEGAEAVGFSPEEFEAETPAETEPTKPEEKPFKFSSTQLSIPKETAEKIVIQARIMIDEADLYEPEGGFEENPHITIKYGIHTDKPDEIAPLFEGMKPIDARLGLTDVFDVDKEGESYDVVVVTAYGPDLHAANKRVSKGTKVTDTYPDYEPHLTLAYVKRGTGKKYAGERDFEGMKFTFDKVEFSDREGTLHDIPLGEQKSGQIESLEKANVPTSKAEISEDEGPVAKHPERESTGGKTEEKVVEPQQLFDKSGLDEEGLFAKGGAKPVEKVAPETETDKRQIIEDLQKKQEAADEKRNIAVFGDSAASTLADIDRRGKALGEAYDAARTILSRRNDVEKAKDKAKKLVKDSVTAISQAATAKAEGTDYYTFAENPSLFGENLTKDQRRIYNEIADGSFDKNFNNKLDAALGIPRGLKSAVQKPDVDHLEYIPPYSLTVLEDSDRLKGMAGKIVKRDTVLQALGGKGVKGIEKTIINEVLEYPEFQGKQMFPFDDFKRAVQMELMPLKMIDTGSYADYGLQNTGIEREAEESDHPVDADTHLWNTDLDHGHTGHFGSAFQIGDTSADRFAVPIDYKIESREQNGKTYYFVVPEGLALTQENIESSVQHVTTDRANAERYLEWIKNRPNDAPNMGLFGHTRVWTFGKTAAIAEIQSDILSKYKAEDLVIESYQKKADNEYLPVIGRVQIVPDKLRPLLKAYERAEEDVAATTEPLFETGPEKLKHLKIGLEREKIALADFEAAEPAVSKYEKQQTDAHKKVQDWYNRESGKYLKDSDGVHSAKFEQNGVTWEVESGGEHGSVAVYERHSDSLSPERRLLSHHGQNFENGLLDVIRVANEANRNELIAKAHDDKSLETPISRETIDLHSSLGSSASFTTMGTATHAGLIRAALTDRFGIEQQITNKKRNINDFEARIKIIENVLDSPEHHEHEANIKNLAEARKAFLDALPLKDKQFIAHKKNNHLRLLREEIRRQALAGMEKVRIPTPRTLALIEGYFTAGEDEDGNGAMPYTVERADNQGHLSEGDTISFDGDSWLVVDSGYDFIKVIPEDKVKSFTQELFVSEQVDHNWEDFAYELKGHDGEEMPLSEAKALVEDAIRWSPGPDLEFMDEAFDLAESENGDDKGQFDYSPTIIFDTDKIETEIRDFYENQINDKDWIKQDLEEVGYKNVFEADGTWYMAEDEHVHSETFSQPDDYTERADAATSGKYSIENFDIEDFSDTEQTVLKGYEELNKAFAIEFGGFADSQDAEPEKKVLTVQDADGNHWLEATIPADQREKPVKLFSRVANPRPIESQTLLAPNGEKSKLSPELHAMVRTSEFKNWFGDWEAAHNGKNGNGVWSHDDVSKVVDINGEPLVVYHGTQQAGFPVFDGGDRGKVPGATFWTDDRSMAASYSGTRAEATIAEDEDFFDREPYDADAEGSDGELVQPHRGVYSAFLNLRNPYETNFEGANWDGSRFDQYKVENDDGEQFYDENGRGYFDGFDKSQAEAIAAKNKAAGAKVIEADEHYETTDSAAREALNSGGGIVREVSDSGGQGDHYGAADVFITIRPEQVKSIHNEGTFDPNEPSILKSVRPADAEDLLFNVLPKAHTQTVLEGIDSTFDPETGALWVSEAASEELRRLLGEEYVRYYGKETDEAPFDGITWTASYMHTLVALGRELTAEYEKAGYTPAQLAKREELLNNIEALANASKDYGVVYTYDDVLPEETFHQMDLRSGRTDDEAISKLQGSPIWTNPGKTFLDQYPGLSDADKASELSAKLATDQAAKYGWGKLPNFEALKTEFLKTWADGVLRKNAEFIQSKGVDAFIRRFGRIAEYADLKTSKASEPAATAASTGARPSARPKSEGKEPPSTTGDKTPSRGKAQSDYRSAARESHLAERLEAAELGVPQAEVREKNRKFAETLRSNGRDDIADVPYIPGSDPERIIEAKRIIADSIRAAHDSHHTQGDYEQAIETFLNPDTEGRTKSVLGIALIDHLGSQGDLAMMHQIADLTINSVGEAAQALQAASIACKYDFARAVVLIQKALQKQGKAISQEQVNEVKRLTELYANSEKERMLVAKMLEDAEGVIAELQADHDEAIEALKAAAGELERSEMEKSGMSQAIMEQMGELATQETLIQNLKRQIDRWKNKVFKDREAAIRVTQTHRSLLDEKQTILAKLHEAFPGVRLKSIITPAMRDWWKDFNPLAANRHVENEAGESIFLPEELHAEHRSLVESPNMERQYDLARRAEELNTQARERGEHVPELLTPAQIRDRGLASAISSPDEFSDDVRDALVKYTALQIFEHESYDDTIAMIKAATEGVLNDSEIAQIHSDAFAMTEKEPTDKTDKQKAALENMKIRSAHKRAAEKFRKGDADKGTVSKRNAGKLDRVDREAISFAKGDEKLATGAICYGRAASADDWVQAMKEYYPDLSDTELGNLLKESRDIRKDARESLLKKATEAKNDITLAKAEWEEIKHKDAIAKSIVRKHKATLDKLYKKYTTGLGDKVLGVAQQVAGVFKGLSATGEFSMIARQNFLLWITHPVKSFAALKSPVRAVVSHSRGAESNILKDTAAGNLIDHIGLNSEARLMAFMEGMRSRPYFDDAQVHGLEFTHIGDFNIHDEHFVSEVFGAMTKARKLWFLDPAGWDGEGGLEAKAAYAAQNIALMPVRVFGRTYEAIELANTLYGDDARLRVYGFYAEYLDSLTHLSSIEKGIAKKYAARAVNAFGGRGDIRKVLASEGPIAKLANLAFFSLRLLISRPQSLWYLTTGFATAPRGMRVQMASEGIKFYAFLALLALLAGLRLDPMDKDFGKIKSQFPSFIDYNVDILAGMDAPLHWLFGIGLGSVQQIGAMARGEKSSAINDNLENLFQKYWYNSDTATRDGTWISGLRYWRGKSSPAASLGFDYFTGKDYIGRTFNWKNAMAQRLVPLAYQNTYRSLYYDRYATVMKEPSVGTGERDILNGLATILGEGIGFGINRYPNEDQSKAEQMAWDMYTPHEPDPRKSLEVKRVETGLRVLFRMEKEQKEKGQDTTAIEQAISKYAGVYEIKPQDLSRLKKQGFEKDFAFVTKELRPDQVEKILSVATEEEKPELETILAAKRKSEEKAEAKKLLPPKSVAQKLNADSVENSIKLYEDKKDEMTPQQTLEFKRRLREKLMISNRKRTLSREHYEAAKDILGTVPPYLMERKGIQKPLKGMSGLKNLY